MSESNTTCSICARPPGGRHAPECPRSRDRMREMALLSRHRPVRALWPGAGAWFRAVVQTGSGQIQKVKAYNPGVPYVGPGKPWTAGGLPLGLDEKGNDRKSLAMRFYDDFIRVIRTPQRELRVK